MSLEILEKAFSHYGFYREPNLDSVWITHSDILPVIDRLSKNREISVINSGASIEGRSIFRIKIGNGKTRILLWSQMHGNESTATRAIYDLINFLTADDDLNEYRNTLLNSLELHFVPMLNPDGAERFIRENAINIDLNRDALSFQTPEAQILQKIKDDLEPEFCFNLHDQNRYYSAGRKDFSPVLSFLAPPSGYNNPVNDARQKAMQIIVHLKSILDKYIPNQVSNYSDDHEPRSFGDNFNRQQSAVILVESGYLKNDTEKEKVREFNFISLLSAFDTITSKSYIKNKIEDYYKIEENKEGYFFDLLLRGAMISRNGNEYKIDIGINRREFPTETIKKLYVKGTIEGLGDLSTYSAYEVIDCTGLTACEGKISSNAISTFEEIKKLNLEQYLSDGFTTVLCKECNTNLEHCRVPINIIQRKYIATHEIRTGFPANIYLQDKNGVRYLVVNGFLIQKPFNINLIRNGLIFR
ncbi:MAG: peptidase M14 [Flavobacterium sp.]|nr:peptidase M14 [Flavobacterium sp.]